MGRAWGPQAWVTFGFTVLVLSLACSALLGALHDILVAGGAEEPVLTVVLFLFADAASTSLVASAAKGLGASRQRILQSGLLGGAILALIELVVCL